MVRRNRASRRNQGGYKKLVGTRAEVMHGTVYKTTYGKVKSEGGNALTKANLKYNKNGRIVSRVKSSKGPALLKQLRDAGYTTQKGKFGAVKTSKKGRKPRNKTRRKTRRCRHKSGRKKGKYKKCNK
jgi:hypothetical protein